MSLKDNFCCSKFCFHSFRSKKRFVTWLTFVVLLSKGNNWGCWDDAYCCTGCGERQEEFYACADILIRSNASPEAVTPTTSATESTSAPPPSAPLLSAETLNLSTPSEGNQSTTTPMSTAICKPDILLDSICKGSGTSCYIYCKGSLAPFLCRGLCSPCYEYLKVCANK